MCINYKILNIVILKNEKFIVQNSKLLKHN